MGLNSPQSKRIIFRFNTIFTIINATYKHTKDTFSLACGKNGYVCVVDIASPMSSIPPPRTEILIGLFKNEPFHIKNLQVFAQAV